jgi:osmotically-inducible protein OsmY
MADRFDRELGQRRYGRRGMRSEIGHDDRWGEEGRYWRDRDEEEMGRFRDHDDDERMRRRFGGSGGSESEGGGRIRGYEGDSFGWFGGPSRVYGGHREQGDRAGSMGARSHMQRGEGAAMGARGFAGRGPKGYARSDDRIREDVCDLLTEDDSIDASELDVRVRDGIVTLSGTVEDRRGKRYAEDLVESCRGVKDVRNEIRIHDRRSQPGATEQTTSQGNQYNRPS